jgi:hypothetical protein
LDFKASFHLYLWQIYSQNAHPSRLERQYGSLQSALTDIVSRTNLDKELADVIGKLIEPNQTLRKAKVKEFMTSAFDSDGNRTARNSALLTGESNSLLIAYVSNMVRLCAFLICVELMID